MRGKNYLPILLIVIVILYFWCNKFSFFSTAVNSSCTPGDFCNLLEGLSDINSFSYQWNSDCTSCDLYQCVSGYTPGKGDLIGECAEIGVTECASPVSNGKLYYNNEKNDGINTTEKCKTVCNPGYRITQDTLGYDTCTWTKQGACIGSDKNGVYTYDSAENCKLQSCKFGYMQSGDKCIPVPPGYYSSSRQI
jgi:hypothetical protein